MTPPETDRSLDLLVSLLSAEAGRGFLYVDEEGQRICVGPRVGSGSDHAVEDTPSLLDDAQRETSVPNPEPACTSTTGPYSRVYTLPDRAGAANCMSATVGLSRGIPTGFPTREAPYVVQPQGDAEVGGDNDEFPFVYVGG